MRSPPPAFFNLVRQRTSGADRRAVHVRDTSHVEKSRGSRLEPINSSHLLVQARTFRAAMNAAPDDQRGDAGFDWLLCELQDHDAAPSSASNGNWRINRDAITQFGEHWNCPSRTARRTRSSGSKVCTASA